MRILHVIDPALDATPSGEAGSGVTGLLALSALIQHDDPSVTHLVVVIGGALSQRSARLAGLRDTVSIGAPLSITEAARGRIRSLIDSFEPNVVQCWSLAAASAASLASERTPRCVVLTGLPDHTPAWKLRARSGSLRASPCFAMNEHDAEKWRGALSSAGQPVWVTTVQPPAAKLARERECDWSRPVIACVTDPIKLVNSQRAASVLCLGASGDMPLGLRLPRGASQTGRARRILSDAARPFDFRLTDTALEALLGADVAMLGPIAVGDDPLVSGASQAVLALAAARSGVLPIVRDVDGLREALPEDVASALLTVDGDALGLTSMLYRVLDNPERLDAVRRSLASRELHEGRNEAFARSLTDAWQRLTPAWATSKVSGAIA